MYAQSTGELDPQIWVLYVLITAATAFFFDNLVVSLTILGLLHPQKKDMGPACFSRLDGAYAAPSSVSKNRGTRSLPLRKSPVLNGGFEKTSTPFKGLQMMDSSEVETLPAPKTQKALPTRRVTQAARCSFHLYCQPEFFEVIFGDLQFLKPAFCIFVVGDVYR